MSQEPVKAKLVCLEVSNLELKFPYNPKEFTVTRNSGVTKKNKGSGPWGGVTWECATPDQLKFDVVLDVSMPDSDVASASSLMLPIASTDAHPPTVSGIHGPWLSSGRRRHTDPAAKKSM